MNYFHQPLDGIPGDDCLPAALHEAAHRWRALDERYMMANNDAGVAERDAAEAEQRDTSLLRQAIRNDKDLPEPTAPAARAAADEAERVAKEVFQVKAEVGHGLLRDVRNHREEIAELARPVLHKAIDDYEAAIIKARSILTGPAAALARATAVPLFLASADQNTSHVTPDTIASPVPDLAGARASIALARDVETLLDHPVRGTLFTVVASNGLMFTQNAETVHNSLTSENSSVTLADPADMSRLRAALDLPEDWEPRFASRHDV